MCARLLLISELCIGTHRLAASLILFQKIIRLVNTSSHLMIQSEENKTREEEEEDELSIFCRSGRKHSRLFGSYPAVYWFVIIIKLFPGRLLKMVQFVTIQR